MYSRSCAPENHVHPNNYLTHAIGTGTARPEAACLLDDNLKRLDSRLPCRLTGTISTLSTHLQAFRPCMGIIGAACLLEEDLRRLEARLPCRLTGSLASVASRVAGVSIVAPLNSGCTGATACLQSHGHTSVVLRCGALVAVTLNVGTRELGNETAFRNAFASVASRVAGVSIVAPLSSGCTGAAACL